MFFDGGERRPGTRLHIYLHLNINTERIANDSLLKETGSVITESLSINSPMRGPMRQAKRRPETPGMICARITHAPFHNVHHCVLASRYLLTLSNNFVTCLIEIAETRSRLATTSYETA